MSKTKAGWRIAAVGLALAGAAFAVTRVNWGPFNGPINALGVDLSQPQAYIATTALSQLPRDLIKAPIARDLLTEDLVTYYEEHEDRLGLKGALRRISYEHELSLSDKLLEMALDEPAEIAFWKDAKGAPRHWLIAMTRNTLAAAIQSLAPLATKDRQISLIGEVKLNGSAVNAYALKLSSRRTIALLAQGNRLVVLSDPGLLFDDARQIDDQAKAVVARLLSGDKGSQAIYRGKLGLSEAPKGHTLIADISLLSLGYQHYLPGIQALRVDVAAGGKSLDTHLRIKEAGILPAATTDRPLWQGLPLGAAACMLVPADWSVVQKTLSSAPKAPPDQARAAWSQLAQQLQGPAALCWYERSQWHTPLLVGRLRPQSPQSHEALSAIAQWALPNMESSSESLGSLKAELWQGKVNAPWGPERSEDAPSYRPTLAHLEQWVSFSPDAQLVKSALDAQARRYPSQADVLPESASTLAVVAPKPLADLTERETFLVLPDQLDVFRQAAEKQWVPRLDALRKLPPARAYAKGTADRQGWVSIEWEPLKKTVSTP